MNDIFAFRDRLINDYQLFSRSFSSPAAPDIASRLAEEYSKERYWSPPLLQINPHYQKGNSVQELAEKGVLDTLCADIFRLGKQQGAPQTITLYKHQEEALAFVAQNRSYVVTTGTGSGKSLAFFIPIVNRILCAKKLDSTPRTRAIIVYPMNALANSQLEEMEKFLGDYAKDKRPISIKRYTGQESQDERNNIKAAPPDILLTNYVMLDLILTRYHEDRKIVEHARHLEFLVLDELHTYRGRQGADVAMLVRRIKAQLDAPNVLCIGTSATMASLNAADDQKKAIAAVASRIFDTTIAPECVIQETLEYATDRQQSVDTAIKKLPERLATGQFVWDSYATFYKDPLAIWIERRLGIVADSATGRLVRAQPKTLQEAAQQLAADILISEIEALQALTSFLTALHNATEWPDGRRPFAFKLHQFISGPGQIATTLEPRGRRAVELDAQRFAPDRQAEEVLLYPTHFCRQCGQEYMPVWYDNKLTVAHPRNIDDIAAANEDGERRYGFLCPAEALTADSFITPCETIAEDSLPDEWFDYSTASPKLRETYKSAIPIPLHVTPQGKIPKGIKPNYWLVPGKFRFCMNCGYLHVAQGRDSNRLVGLSGEGRSSATTVLTLAALKLLFEEPPLAGKDDVRKLLGFTANRQDAALQAGHFNEFIFLVSLRAGLLRALSLHPQGVAQATITDTLFSALGFDTNNKEILAEYLAEPELLGTAKASAQSALRFMLGYRLFQDLGKEWRYNNPNLEQLGLLQIDYADLSDFANREELFSQNNFLAALSPELRAQLARTVFDQLRKALCIETIYFKKSGQDAVLRGDNSYLTERWRLPNDNRLINEQKMYVFENHRTLTQNPKSADIKRALKAGAGSGSRQSAFFKSITHSNIWAQTPYASPNKTVFAGDVPELIRAVQHLLLAASKFGIVSANLIKGNVSADPDNPAHHDVVECALNGAALIWKPLVPTANNSATITNQFFSTLYRSVADLLGTDAAQIYSFESHEHTAQVDNETRRMLEQRFRFGQRDQAEYAAEGHHDKFKRLPVLYCSPTMELGVDISSLNMVYMRNVPPTPANYSQRSGRAGRSGQAAIALTYCTSLSPHDQWFYANISEMVHGQVRVPTIDLSNQELFNSHIQAVWLSCVKIDLPTVIIELLVKEPDQNPTLAIRPEFWSAFTSSQAAAEAIAIAKTIANAMPDELSPRKAPWYHPTYIDALIAKAPAGFDQALNRWRELYKATQRQCHEADKIARSPTASSKERQIAQSTYNDALEQLNVLTSTSTKNSDFYLYRYLASQGFLPGYSFSRLPLVAWIPRSPNRQARISRDDAKGTLISRPRFLALSEFGPRSLIYHEGRTYRVNRIKLRATSVAHVAADGRLGTINAYVCDKCGYGVFDDEHSATPNNAKTNTCPLCNNPLLPEKTLIQALYRVDAVEAQAAERITVRDEERQRQGFEIQTTYSFAKSAAGLPECHTINIVRNTTTLATFTYSAAARIWRVNKGWRRRKDQSVFGFYINPLNGQWSKREDPDSAPEDMNAGEERAANQRIVPYVADFRNLLIFAPPESLRSDRAAMSTLMAALQRSMEQVFQVESSELASEFLPSASNPQKILIYESSEGGAGVLGRLTTDPARAQVLATIAQTALKLMHYHHNNALNTFVESDGHCEAGCYRCLLSYYNQPEHEFINRRNPKVKEYLEKLLSINEHDFQEATSAIPVTNNAPFIAEVLRRGLKQPTHQGYTLANGSVADALYQADRCVVAYAAPSSELQHYCTESGLQLLLFPGDKLQWDTFFNETQWLFREGATL